MSAGKLLRRLQGSGGYADSDDSVRARELESYGAGLDVGSDAASRALAEAFPDSADELIAEWEGEYRVPNDAARSLEERRARLRAAEEISAPPEPFARALERVSAGAEPVRVAPWEARASAAGVAAALRIAANAGAGWSDPARRRALERLLARIAPARVESDVSDGSGSAFIGGVLGRSALTAAPPADWPALEPDVQTDAGTLAVTNDPAVTISGLDFAPAPGDVVIDASGYAHLVTNADPITLDREGVTAGACTVYRVSALLTVPPSRALDGSRDSRVRAFGAGVVLRAADLNRIQDSSHLLREGTGNLPGAALPSQADEFTAIGLAFEATVTNGTATFDDETDWRNRIIHYSISLSSSDIRPNGAAHGTEGTHVTGVFYSGASIEWSLDGSNSLVVSAGGDLQVKRLNSTTRFYGIITASARFL